MTDVQKIIKYIAIAFAVYLIVMIFSAIIFGIACIGNIFGEEKTLDNMEELKVESKEFQSLEIDISAANLIIKNGETWKVETNNAYMEIKEASNKLTVKEKTHGLWNANGETQLIVYLPTNTDLKEVKIKTGAGKITIDDIACQNLKLDLGAGKVSIENLIVKQETEIDGGAGEIEILNGALKNLDLDMGVGKVSITSALTGKSDIDAGVGELNINILGKKEDYSFDIDKGVGAITIDGETISAKEKMGTGQNKLEIDGGVGNIKIEFNQPTKEETKETFTKTYKVITITESTKEAKVYLTVQEYQGEVETVLIDKNYNLSINKTYEFTFRKSGNTEDNIKSIFANCEIVSVEETTKQGSDQTQESPVI